MTYCSRHFGYVIFFSFFNYFFACTWSSLVRLRHSLEVAVNKGCSCCGGMGFSCGDSCCRAWALGHTASVVVARALLPCGMESSGIRTNPCPCTSRWILDHCTTREVWLHIFLQTCASVSLGWLPGRFMGVELWNSRTWVAVFNYGLWEPCKDCIRLGDM